MPGVQRRKRKMVEAMIQNHLDRYKASGAELIVGTARFVTPNTVEVALNGGGTKTMAGERIPESGHKQPFLMSRDWPHPRR